MLGTPGRVLRLAAIGLVLGLLVAGTVAGSDDHFPFGPFSMYSSAHDPNAGVVSNTVEAVLDDGRVAAVSDGGTGIATGRDRGQLHRFVEDPQAARAAGRGPRAPAAGRSPLRRRPRRAYQFREGRGVVVTGW